MRYFSLLDFQHMVLAAFIGLALIVVLYLAFGVNWPKRRMAESPESEGDEGYHRSEHHRPARLLVVVYIALAVWSAAYMVLIGIFGGGIG